jgi:hypothetical protein
MANIDRRADAVLLDLERELVALERAIETAEQSCGDAIDAMCSRRNALAVQVFSTPAQGFEGLAVQARIFAREAKEELALRESGPLDFETMGNVLAQGILRLAGYGLRPDEGSDPVFAAIEAHRAAWEVLAADYSRLADDETPAAQAKLEKLNQAVSDARDALANTEPTTMAGAIALLRYVSKYADERTDELVVGDMFAMLADALEEMTAGA